MKLAGLRNEDGSANIVAFMVIIPLILLGFFFVWHINTAKDARKGFDEKVMMTAKAAAAQTYTTNDGVLRIDLDDATAEAKQAYDLYKPFVHDSMSYSVLDPARDAQVTVTCKPDPSPTGEGCIGVEVEVDDTYRGNVFTSGWWFPYELKGRSGADLVVTP